MRLFLLRLLIYSPVLPVRTAALLTTVSQALYSRDEPAGCFPTHTSSFSTHSFLLTPQSLILTPFLLPPGRCGAELQTINPLGYRELL